MPTMSGDFYEDDEPVEKIKAAFEAGTKHETGEPFLGFTTYLAVATYRPLAEDQVVNRPTGELVSRS